MTNPANAESIVQYQILGTLEIPDTRYLIFFKAIQYEADTNTDTDIITALLPIPVLIILDLISSICLGFHCESVFIYPPCWKCTTDFMHLEKIL